MSFSPRPERALNDAIHVANTIIDTLKSVLKERDDMIDELIRTNTRLQANNQDHINTITCMESELEDSRATATGRADVIQTLYARLEEQRLKLIIWTSRAKDAEKKLATVNRTG